MPATRVQVDGQTLEFPEGMSQTEIKAVLRERFPPQSAPATFGERLQASFSATPEAKTNLLRERFGADNVFMMPNGRIAFRRSPDESFRRFDEEEATLGDIADVTGELMSAAPGFAVGLMQQTPGGRAGTLAGTALRAVAVGGADAGGQLAREAVSAALPGDSGTDLAGVARRTAVAGGLGAAAQGGAERLFAPAATAANPRNIIPAATRRAEQSFGGRRGIVRARQTGIPLTPGQETNSSLLLGLEGLARRHPLTAGQVEKVDNAAVEAVANRLTGIAERLSRSEGAENTGRLVRTTFTKAVDDALELRRRTAKRDFAVIDSVTGSRPIIPVENFRATLDELIDAEDIIGGSPILSSLQKLKKSIDGQVEAQDLGAVQGQLVISGRKLANSLSAFSRASKGTGRVFADLERAEQRRVAGILADALQRDLDAIAGRAAGALGDRLTPSQLKQLADLGGEGAEAARVATALTVARDNYRLNSQVLGELEDSALGRMLNVNRLPADDVLAERVGKLPPSELRQAMAFLVENNSQAAGAVRRNILEEMLDRSVVSGNAGVTEGSTFSIAKFRTQFLNAKTSKRLRASMTKDQFRDLQRTSNAMARVFQRSGSDTAKWQMLRDFAGVVGGGIGNVANVTGVSRIAGEVLTVRRIASAMADPGGRAALREISRPGPQSIATVQAVSTLIGIWQLEEQRARQAARAQTREFGRQTESLDGAL